MPLQRDSSFVKVGEETFGISCNLHQHLGRAEERVAKLVDSPDRPESEASYKLDEGGWSDV